jgi:hypothetical protein
LTVRLLVQTLIALRQSGQSGRVRSAIATTSGNPHIIKIIFVIIIMTIAAADLIGVVFDGADPDCPCGAERHC